MRYKNTDAVPIKENRSCLNCGNCVYVGDSGYLCDCRQEIVIEYFSPTCEFMCCNGKDWVEE